MEMMSKRIFIYFIFVVLNKLSMSMFMQGYTKAVEKHVAVVGKKKRF